MQRFLKDSLGRNVDPVVKHRRIAGVLFVMTISMSCLGQGRDTNTVFVRGAHPESDTSNKVGLGDRLVVEVNKLEQLLRDAKAQNKQVILYLNNFGLKGVYPESCDPGSNSLRFHLQRSETSRSAWSALLGKPDAWERDVAVSVGIEDTCPIPTEVDHSRHFKLIVVPRGSRTFICVAVLLAIICGAFALAICTEMIRDSGPKPEDKKLRPYSLARFQMAFWFVLVISAYVFLWLVTGTLDTLTTTVLTLIGIGAGTALGAEVQDASKPNKKEALLEEKRKLQGLAQRTTEETARMEEIKTALGTVKAPASDNFLNDVLTDAVGISLHRFQMFVWTIVLGIIFVFEVYQNLAMPEFSATLLGLMGISAGTYLGFMIPEKHSSQQSS